MRPAHLSPAGVEVGVGTVPVGRGRPEFARDEFAQHRAAAGRSDQEGGHGGGHGDPEPGALPGLSPAGLGDVDRAAGDAGVGLGGNGFERRGGPVLEAAHAGRADGHAERVAHQPGDAPLADAVPPGQQRGRGLDAGAVPGRRVGWKFAAGDAAAPGAGQAVAAVLGDVACPGERQGVSPLLTARRGVTAGAKLSALA